VSKRGAKVGTLDDETLLKVDRVKALLVKAEAVVTAQRTRS
jgi:hypothetical protein